MKWLTRLLRRFVRLVALTAAFTAVVVMLDAVLSPDSAERSDGDR